MIHFVPLTFPPDLTSFIGPVQVQTDLAQSNSRLVAEEPTLASTSAVLYESHQGVTVLGFPRVVVRRGAHGSVGSDDEQQLWLRRELDAVGAADRYLQEAGPVVKATCELFQRERFGAENVAGDRWLLQVRLVGIGGDPVDVAVTQVGAQLGCGKCVEVITAREQQ